MKKPKITITIATLHASESLNGLTAFGSNQAEAIIALEKVWNKRTGYLKKDPNYLTFRRAMDVYGFSIENLKIGIAYEGHLTEIF